MMKNLAEKISKSQKHWVKVKKMFALVNDLNKKYYAIIYKPFLFLIYSTCLLIVLYKVIIFLNNYFIKLTI